MTTAVGQHAMPERKWRGPRMVAIAFLMQNTATGLTFGSFGAIVLSIQSTYHTSRTLASLGLSLVILSMCCAAPVIGAKLRRWSIRRTMIGGILLGSIGYGLLAAATSIWQVLIIYTLVIGPSIALFQVLVSNTLVSNWYIQGQGRALGIVNMPLFVMMVPLVSIVVLQRFGLSALFLGMAVFHLIVLPAAFLVIDRPEDVGMEPLGEPAPPAINANGVGKSEAGLVRTSAFWLLTIGFGLVIGIGALKLAHLVPLLVDRGRSEDQGSILLAIAGGTGMIGSLVFGWLADRWGAGASMALNAALQAATWVILLLPVGMPLLIVDAVISGLCGGGVSSAQGVLIRRLFGVAAFPRIYGLMSIITVPFLFCASPAMGYAYDVMGSYFWPVAAIIVCFLMTIPLFLYLARQETFARRLDDTGSGATA